MRLQSEDYGKHLMGVDDLLQKHSLLEADIKVIGERVKSVNGQADPFSQPGADDDQDGESVSYKLKTGVANSTPKYCARAYNELV